MARLDRTRQLDRGCCLIIWQRAAAREASGRPMVAHCEPPGEAPGGGPTSLQQLQEQASGKGRRIGRKAAQQPPQRHSPLTAPLPPPRRPPGRLPPRPLLKPHCNRQCVQAAAFQGLLALDALPQSGREAREAARSLGELVLASAVPPPLLSQLVVEHLEGLPPARPRFVDVSTGARACAGSVACVLACRRRHAAAVTHRSAIAAVHPRLCVPASCWGRTSTHARLQAHQPLPHAPSIPHPHPTAAGLRLRYLEWGSGGRDVVLLLHDCGEAADVWRPLGPRLADRGYRVIAPDLRGEGPRCAACQLSRQPAAAWRALLPHAFLPGPQRPQLPMRAIAPCLSAPSCRTLLATPTLPLSPPALAAMAATLLLRPWRVGALAGRAVRSQ